jgi:hypothetical protein
MTITTDVVTAITGHHKELQESLSTRVENVVTAARADAAHESAVAELRGLLTHDIVPHARAEEDVLYAAATEPTLRPFVSGMLFEHETLLGLVADLAGAVTAVDAAAIARAIEAVFVGHVRRENELLLPALAASPQIDLPALLPVMQDRFAFYRAAASAAPGSTER